MSKKPSKYLDSSLRSDSESELLDTLKHRVVGQETAIEALVDAYFIYQAGLCDPEHPISNLIFLGPTGCGKTHIIEIMAEILFGTKKAVRKVNCAEFQHSHEISKLIGSPPGYLGHKDTVPYLTQENIDKFQTPDNQLTLLLFDEFEKSNDALWNLLLGILDKASVMLGTGVTTYFDKCIITMTGNLGAREMAFLLKGGMGFSGSAMKTEEEIDKSTEKVALDAARNRFNPEFLNRIDDTVVFHPLGKTQLEKVVEIELELVQSRVLKMKNPRQFVLDYTPSAKAFILDKGTDIKNGARPLKRAIEKHVTKRLARFLSTRQISLGDLVQVDVDKGDRLRFSRIAEGVITKQDIEEEAKADAAMEAAK